MICKIPFAFRPPDSLHCSLSVKSLELMLD